MGFVVGTPETNRKPTLSSVEAIGVTSTPKPGRDFYAVTAKVYVSASSPAEAAMLVQDILIARSTHP